LEKLDKEANDLTRAQYKGISSLRPLAYRIQVEILRERKSLDSDLKECVVVCYGPFHHGIGLVSDTVQVLIAHTPSTLSKEDILFGLHCCGELGQLRSRKGQYNCSVDVLYSGLVTGNYRIERWFQRGFRRALECYIQIVSLPEISWDELRFFDDYTYKMEYGGTTDVSGIPEPQKGALLQLHLERYIYANDVWCCYEITLLLRKMVKARGLCKYLPPMILHLLALRHAKEAGELHSYYQQMGFYAKRSDFNLVKFICTSISEYDFENMNWHVEGDKVGPGGTCLRIMHPLYPDIQINPPPPPIKTEVVRRQLRMASQAQTVSGFVRSKALAKGKARGQNS
jgi:hypothetical protein